MGHIIIFSNLLFSWKYKNKLKLFFEMFSRDRVHLLSGTQVVSMWKQKYCLKIWWKRFCFDIQPPTGFSLNNSLNNRFLQIRCKIFCTKNEKCQHTTESRSDLDISQNLPKIRLNFAAHFCRRQIRWKKKKLFGLESRNSLRHYNCLRSTRLRDTNIFREENIFLLNNIRMRCNFLNYGCKCNDLELGSNNLMC